MGRGARTWRCIWQELRRKTSQAISSTVVVWSSMCRFITLESQWTTIDTGISILFGKHPLGMKWWRLLASICRRTNSINSRRKPMILLIFIPQCIPSCDQVCAKFCVLQFCQMSFECCQFNAGNSIPCREWEWGEAMRDRGVILLLFLFAAKIYGNDRWLVAFAALVKNFVFQIAMLYNQRRASFIFFEISIILSASLMGMPHWQMLSWFFFERERFWGLGWHACCVVACVDFAVYQSACKFT